MTFMLLTLLVVATVLAISAGVPAGLAIYLFLIVIIGLHIYTLR